MTALRDDAQVTKGRADSAALFLSAVSGVSVWFSAGVVLDGGSERIAALPSLQLLAVLVVVAPAMAWIAKLRLEHAWPLAISLILWLPFLGLGSIWEGPIEGIVWLLVAVGLIAARPPAVPDTLSNPTSAPLIAGLAIALVSALVFSQVRNVIPGGDEPHYLAATQSILHDGDLKVANNYEKGEYLDYFPGRLEPHFLKRSTSGEIYSVHAPGVSVMVLPAFAMAGYSGAVWTMILVAAMSCSLMWRMAFAVTGRAAAAWVGVVGVALSAPYFFHTFTIYPEIIGGLCVLMGVWVLIELAAGRGPDSRILVAVGAALAALPWLHTRFAMLAGVIGILVLARLAKRPNAGHETRAFLAVPVVLGLAWFGFFYVIYGSPNPTVAYGADTSTSMAYVPRGVIGLLFDQQFGVLTTAPIYLTAIAGAVILLRTHTRLAIELALIVIPYVLVVASYAMWWGGSAAPGRFLVSILPLAALPIAVVWSSSKALRAVTLVLTVVSASLIVPRAFEDAGRFIYNNRSGVDATLQWLSANVNLPAMAPSVHGDGGFAAVRDGLMWIGVLVAATITAGVVGRGRSDGAGVTIASVVLALSVGVGATLLTADPLRSDRQLVMLERLRPSWQSTIVELNNWNRPGIDDLRQRLSSRVVGPASVLNRVPAGEYQIVGAPGTPTGSMKIFLGRNDSPIAEPTLDALRNPQAPFTFRLPVMARNLNFRVESDTRDPIEWSLQPIGVVTAVSRQPATRAARFGSTTRAFFFDDWAYPERDGFWTRADGLATVVIDSDGASQQSGLALSVTAGQVPTTVHLSMGSWAESLTLAAGEKRDLVLPPPVEGVWTVHIRSGAGFRPSESDPGNRDVRTLAAWIAVR